MNTSYHTKINKHTALSPKIGVCGDQSLPRHQPDPQKQPQAVNQRNAKPHV